jgi:hypothetical protein
MPAEYYIDVPCQMVFSRGYGGLNFSDARHHMERLLSDPDFHPEFNQLIDFRRVEEVTITTEEIVLLAARNVFSPKSRRAFVVASDLQFGLARMFGTYRENAGEHGIKPFREMEPALKWLSLTDEPDSKRFVKLTLTSGNPV